MDEYQEQPAFDGMLDSIVEAGVPVSMTDGSLIVSTHLMMEFQKLQEQMLERDIPSDILFGGLLFAMLGIVSDSRSWPAALKTAKEMELPMHSGEGLRSRIVALLDALGLEDDGHKFN